MWLTAARERGGRDTGNNALPHGVAPEMTMLMSSSVAQLVGAPLWSRLQYPSNDCNERLFRHSWSPEDEYKPMNFDDLQKNISMRPPFLSFSEISWQLSYMGRSLLLSCLHSKC